MPSRRSVVCASASACVSVSVCINHWRWRRHLIFVCVYTTYIFQSTVSIASCNTWTHLTTALSTTTTSTDINTKNTTFFLVPFKLRCAFDDVSRFSTSRAFSNEWVLTDCKSRRLDLSFENCVCVRFFFSLQFFFLLTFIWWNDGPLFKFL